VVSSPRTSPAVRSGRRPADSGWVAGFLDAAVVAVWFAVSGLIGALVWWQVTTLPKVRKSGDAATLAPAELVKQVGIDGWFFVIAIVGGLLGGIVLLSWRHRDPLLMVVLVVLGGGLASWLMTNLGLALGPDKELAALRSTADGSTVPLQLKLHAPGMAWIWSFGAALGALVSVWVLARPGADSTD
jgi:hypothetical protein